MAGRGISGSGVSRPSSGMSAWRGVSRPAKAVVGAVRGVRLVSMALSRRVDPAFGFVCARIMYARRHREQFASGFRASPLEGKVMSEARGAVGWAVCSP